MMGSNSPAGRAVRAAVTTVFTTGLVLAGSSVAQSEEQDNPGNAPVSAAPAAPASTDTATARADDAFHIKNAKNVSSKPPRRTDANKVVCTAVRGARAVTLGKVCFEPSGDKFWVWDRRSDGRHIVMRAMYSGNPQTVFDCRNFKGKDAGWTRCGFANKLKENRKINFNALAYKGNNLKYDGATVTAQN